MSGFIRENMRLMRNYLVSNMLDCGNNDDKFSTILHSVGVDDLGDMMCVEACYFDDVIVKSVVNNQVVNSPMTEEDKQLVLSLVTWIRMKRHNIVNKLSVDEWMSLDAKEFYAFIDKPVPVCKPKVIVTSNPTSMPTTAPIAVETEVKHELEEVITVNEEVASVEEIVEECLDVTDDYSDEDSVVIDFCVDDVHVCDASVFDYCWFYDSNNNDNDQTYCIIEQAMTQQMLQAILQEELKIKIEQNNLNKNYVTAYLPSLYFSYATYPSPAFVHQPKVLVYLLVLYWHMFTAVPNHVMWKTDGLQPYKGVKYKHKYKFSILQVTIIGDYIQDCSNVLVWGE